MASLALVDGDGRLVARFFTGWSNVVFLFIVTSRLLPVVPTEMDLAAHPVQRILNGKLRGRARDFNLAPRDLACGRCSRCFVIVASALPMSFPWANAALYRAVGEEPPSACGRWPASWRRLLRRPRRAPEVWRDVAYDAIERALDSRAKHGNGLDDHHHARACVGARTVDVPPIDRGKRRPATGFARLSPWIGTWSDPVTKRFADQKLGARLRSFSRFAHTGEVLGVTGQTIAGLASAAPRSSCARASRSRFVVCVPG
jgi:hypothetical protein